MKIATIIARSLLGIIFVVFGSNLFLRFIPMPPPPEGPARDFMTVLFVSHYLYVAGALQVAGGFLLFTAVDASGPHPGRSGNREHRLLSRLDGAGRLADGHGRFGFGAFLVMELPSELCRHPGWRPRAIGFTPSTSHRRNRDGSFLRAGQKI